MIPAPDLLVIGGLSIDRFPDGSRRAGGAVLHGTRAAAADGFSVASVVLVGPEPEAARALVELHAAGPCRLHDAERSIRFGIDERGPHRRLVLESRGGRLRITPAEIATFGAHAVLFAPVAAEIGVASVRGVSSAVRVGALQGWLRTLKIGQVVHPRAPASLPRGLAEALGRFDALVASVDDLGTAGEPLVALAALRRAFGERPLLVVTAGERGAWLDVHGTARIHVEPPLVVAGVSTVGAGDAFAALLTAALGRRLAPQAAAQRAATGVSEILARRRADPGILG
jgi:sugar/nucleoside kinase (ribokinase family)